VGGVLPMAFDAPASAATGKIWTAPGGYEFMVPAGVTTMTVTVTGAGGGGAGSHTEQILIEGDPTKMPGGGGGGGATSTCSRAVTPGQKVALAVGAGGNGGDYGKAGANGGVSYFEPQVAGASAFHASGDGGWGAGAPTAVQSLDSRTASASGQGLSDGGSGGSYIHFKWCSSEREGKAGGSASVYPKMVGGAGGLAATPGTGCPAGAGNGGKGGDLDAGGAGGRHGCVVVTW
jgi:hypothetical protein